MAEIADWVFESVLQFLRSPLWQVPINSFIDANCGKFDADEQENKLEYTAIHNQFREMVDDLLSSFIEELGASPEAFIEAIKSGRCKELSDMVTEYIVALDDFRSFRAMMEKRNIEAELEAMSAAANWTSSLSGEERQQPMMTEDEQERLLLDMAIQASLTEHDVIMKRMEKEDAELLQALIMSIALEQERVIMEQLRRQAERQTTELPVEEKAAIEEESKQQVARMHQQVHEMRVINVEKHVDKLAETHPLAPVTPTPVATPAVAPTVVAPAAPVAVAPSPVATSGSSLGAMHVHTVAGPSKAAEVSSALLAPVDRLGGRTGAIFGGYKPLPGIGASHTVAPPVVPQVVHPTIDQLKQHAVAQKAVPTKAEPSPEEIAQREAYLKAQRERLQQAKAAKGQAEIQAFAAQSGGAPPSPTATPAGAAPGTVDMSKQKEMCRALARRFKEDMLEETRKQARAE